MKILLPYVRAFQLGRKRVFIGLAALLLLFGGLPAKAQQELETLRVNGQIFNHVVVQSRTASHIFFNHDQGFSSVKLIDLPLEAQQKLGLVPASAKGTSKSNSYLPIAEAPQVLEKTLALAAPMQADLLPFIKDMLWVFVVITIVGHLFISFCFMLMCQKTGTPPGMMVWIPVLHWIPLFRAAHMPLYNFALLFLPFINFVVLVAWCFKICQALGKSPWLGLLLLLPGINILTTIYLAFSGNGGEEEEGPLVKLEYVQSASD